MNQSSTTGDYKQVPNDETTKTTDQETVLPGNAKSPVSEIPEKKTLQNCLLLLICLLLLDILFKTWLYETSIDFISWLQTNLGPTGVVVFEKITFLGEDAFGVVMLAIGFALYNQKVAIFVVLYLYYESIAITILKELYKQPRPLYSDYESVAYHCSHTFGHPSGHSAKGATNFLLAYFFIQVSFRPGVVVDWTIYALFWIGISLVGLSRLVIGVHALDHVLYSFWFMAVSNIILVYYVYPWVCNMIDNLRAINTPTLLQKENSKTNSLFFNHTLLATVAYCLLLALLCFYGYETFVYPENWLTNLLGKAQNCTEEHKANNTYDICCEYKDNTEFPNNSQGAWGYSAYNYVPFGALFGLIVDYVWFGGAKDNIYVGSSIVQSLIRLILVGGYCIGLFYLGDAIDEDVFSLQLTYILRAIISFGTWFLLFAFGRKVLETLGLIPS